MSQTSIASYFPSRKRAATDEINTKSSKVFIASDNNHVNNSLCRLIYENNDIKGNESKVKESANKLFKETITTEENFFKLKNIKRIAPGKKKSVNKNVKSKAEKDLIQKKLVPFTKAGLLSPNKKYEIKIITEKGTAFSSKDNINNVERGLKTPTKQSFNGKDKKSKIANLVKKELNFEEVKNKVTRSAKLQELKASLGRLQELDKIRTQQKVINKTVKEKLQFEPKSPINLKEFKTIDLEVLASPKKGFKTPTKTVPPPPDKNVLMSPKDATPRKIIFSPSKDGSPSKIVQPPAYQRFQNLIQPGKPVLQLPYKYRCLMEIYRCLDSVCALFYNRKEIITFKKLKPAVQRMLRKNFNENHLAQIKNLYPEGFQFTQMKMRNFGSISKQDYYQLVVTPNIDRARDKSLTKIDEDNILQSAQSNAMNPQVMIERQQIFFLRLLDKVREEHDQFLKTLDPPLIIPKEKVSRWHPEFDLENCPEIAKSQLPQPPNIEKFSSAKDILSTARNLFNCSTANERSMELYEQHQKTESQNENANVKLHENPNSSILKGVPQALLDKIRAKQAAKALDAMTRRPSQDREAIKYSRLPELARHLKNVFVTEKKSVLPMELIISKIENSYRACLIPKEIESHIRLIAKECPEWLVFHEIRKTIYIKIMRDIDMTKILERLELVANEKTK